MILPFTTKINKNNEISLYQNYPIHFIGGKLSEFLVYVFSGIGIAKGAIIQEEPIIGSEEEIVKQIHQERFDPQNTYVITGGHFHQLYIRNLGIFYNAILDARIQAGEKDWENRQRITLQTLALDLAVFHEAKKTYTTIVPITSEFYTAMNVRTTPSDTLFAIVYTLCALIDSTFIETLFPTHSKHKKYKLQTISAGKELLGKYISDLKMYIEEYKNTLLDPTKGIIRKDIYLAGAMDGVKRESGFYDNVILWATCRLAGKLGLLTINNKKLLEWKQRIISTFWDEHEGIFLDDLSLFIQKEKIFATDALIVLSTQFLSVDNKMERKMLERTVAFIQKNKMDVPFPLLFTKKDYKHRMYFLVEHLVPEYMGTGVWSHLGTEYIKLLILLGKYEKKYKQEAQKWLLTYKNTIEKHGGYPELHNNNGNIYTKGFYKAVLRNGWVINYEQAKMLYEVTT